MSFVKTASIGMIAAALLLTGCGGNATHEKKAAANEPALRVQTVAAEATAIQAEISATGTVRARVATAISARVMAYVREIRVQAGDSFRAGQALVTLDSREVETALRQAEQARMEARSALGEVQNAIAAAKAQLDLASATFQRMKTLFDQKSITNQEFDEASARRAMAQANFDMAGSKKSQVEARIRQADEAVAQAQVMKTYTEVSAPFAGVVVERKAEAGTLAAPGMPLLLIEQTGSYRLEAQVEEAQAGKVRAGGKAVVELESLGKTFDARISEVSQAIDPQSRSFTAKIDLPGLAGLRGGMYGRARFPAGERTALLVPAQAVVAQGQLRKVFVHEGGMARARFVTLGAPSGDRVEVLSGLTGADRVVSPVPAGLADGARIEVRP